MIVRTVYIKITILSENDSTLFLRERTKIPIRGSRPKNIPKLNTFDFSLVSILILV